MRSDGTELLEEAQTSSLDALINEHGLENLPPIDGEDQASRWMWAVKFARDELARLESDYQQARARLDALHEDRTHGTRRKVAHLERMLTDWHRAQHAKDDRVTSVSFTAGSAKSRAGSWSTAKDDETELHHWIAGRLAPAADDRIPELEGTITVETKYKVNSRKLMALLDRGRDGESDRPLTPVPMKEQEEGSVQYQIAVKATGEVLPAVRAVIGDRKFSIEVD